MTEQAAPASSVVSVKLLLEAGAHFGHQVGRWNPKMKRYIFIERNGIHIINLEQTINLLDKASRYVTDLVAQGGDILFVGTKKQAQDAIEQEAKKCGMPYVNQRWIGGMLTNFNVIQSRVDYLVHLEDQRTRGFFHRLPKKEVLRLEKEDPEAQPPDGQLQGNDQVPCGALHSGPVQGAAGGGRGQAPGCAHSGRG